jgi:hypothetical protein
MIWPVMPQPTEGQRIGNKIKAAMVFAWANLVNVHRPHFAALLKSLREQICQGGLQKKFWMHGVFLPARRPRN